MDYTPDWNLRSIPDDLLHSEVARRRVSKRIRPGNVKLEACAKCGKMLNARQRRLRCPDHGANMLPGNALNESHSHFRATPLVLDREEPSSAP